MKRKKFDSLVPVFFCVLGKFYAQKPAFFWDYLFHVSKYLLEIVVYFQQLEMFDDFEYGLDDLVYPLLENFIHSQDPQALRELVEELAKVRAFLRQELDFRGCPRL